MGTELGIVVEVHDSKAGVRLNTPEECAGCAAVKGCRAGDPSHIIQVANHVGASPGQKVKVEVRGSVTVMAAVLLYGMPVTALVIGAIVGPEIARAVGVAVSTNVSAAAGGLFLLCGAIAGARVADKWFSANPELGPRIIRVVNESNTNNGGVQ